jgi:DNA-binding response OmpR family regulator
MHTLIVEDDLALAEAFETALEPQVASVDTARSIEDAIDLVMRRNYDLVVLDFFLPDGNTAGVSDLVRLRNPKAAIISVTGSRIFASGQHNKWVSSDYFLRKPVDMQEFADIASYLCGDLKSLNKDQAVNA